MKHVISDHLEQETYQTNVYLYFAINNLASFMGIPESIRLLYNNSLLTET
jgi:hypothetical protein